MTSSSSRWTRVPRSYRYPDSMIRSFGQDARSNAVNDRARVLMICLYMPALASERGCPIRTQPLPQLPAWPWKTNSITLRCGGALSSRVLCYLNANTIEYYGQSSTRHLEIVRFFLGAAIPRGDCGCCAVMQCCGPSWWRCKETWI